MKFGGIQKVSLIDFPGKLSCVIFLTGCNYACPYCHNPDLARGAIACSEPLTQSWIMEFLEKRKGFLDGVVISGGEPTLQKALPGLCRKIKEMGYAVKLDTNGSRPAMLQDLMHDALIDYIAMDIKTDPAAYVPWITPQSDADAVLASIRLLMESDIAYEFRTTCVRPMVDDRVIDRISALIQGARCYALQQFHEATLLNPEFFKDTPQSYSNEELLALKSIADSRVDTCIVRASDI